MDDIKPKDLDVSHTVVDDRGNPQEMDIEGKHLEGAPVYDQVFGDVGEGRVQYRGMKYWATVIVMIKVNIGLGVLAVPFLFQVLGMAPGIIVFVAMAGLITWCTYQIKYFKLAHPEIYAIDDIGYIFGGKIGREVLSISMVLFYVTCSGSGILALSVALNAISLHGACTAIFVAVGAILVFLGSSIRTLARLSWVGWVGAGSILVAVMTLLIAVGVNDRPALAPQEGPFTKIVYITAKPTFASAASVLGGMMFTLAGTPAFFPIISEMKDPKRYGSAFLTCQAVIVTVDVLVGAVVYHYCGQYVASPAPGSAGVLLKRVVYGLALPGVFFSSLIFNHFAAKYLYVRIMRNSEHISARTWQSYTAWFGCVTGCTLVAYVVCSGIPIFGPLSSLIGALFGPMVSLIPIPMMWFYLNWHRRHEGTTKVKLLMGWAALVWVLGVFIMIAGTYGSIVDIKAAFASDSLSRPWSCDDNSNSS